jgi:hypothetical protein
MTSSTRPARAAAATPALGLLLSAYDAGPAGLAIINDVARIGAVTGHRLLRVQPSGISVTSKRRFLIGTYGRLRTAEAAPNGTLWLTTSNSDHRATRGPRDDRILKLRVS